MRTSTAPPGRITTRLCQQSFRARSSVQHKRDGDRHPHRDRLPTPASRLEAPASDCLDRRPVEIGMSRRLLHLDPFYAPLFGDIGLDHNGPLNTPSPGRIRVTWFHLITT